MAGRNGVDQLGRAVMFGTLILLLVSMFTHGRLSSVLFILVLLGIVYMYFRMFSRNVAKRRAENAWYLSRTRSIRTYFRSLGERSINSSAAPHAGRCSGCPEARAR